jgi:hypothetical protein
VRISPRTSFRLVAALAIVCAVLACGRRGEEERTTVPPAMIPAPAPLAVLRVTDVDVGSAIGPDKRIIEENEDDEFKPNDTVYASVATDGTASNANLTARWIFQDGRTVAETNQTISPSGPAITEFHAAKPSGWPRGKYKVEILLNGTKVDEEEFEVKK